MKTLLCLTHQEVQSCIPYMLVCEGRHGSRWETIRRRRRWRSEFTESERTAATRLFYQAKMWGLIKGVPDTVRMTPETYRLWQKLGAFCASL